MILEIIISLAAGFMYTEFVGHFVHRLLHSEKVPWLSRNHMIHHLKHYSPKMPMRSGTEYQNSSKGRGNLGGVGLEWIIPISSFLVPSIAFMIAVGVPWVYQISMIGSALAWGIIGFGYMHDAMHVEGVWLLKNRWLTKWFKGARKLHDVHHTILNDNGRMTKNFGISFFFLDRLFGTFAGKVRGFNDKGFEQAKNTYSFIYDEPEP